MKDRIQVRLPLGLCRSRVRVGCVERQMAGWGVVTCLCEAKAAPDPLELPDDAPNRPGPKVKSMIGISTRTKLGCKRGNAARVGNLTVPKHSPNQGEHLKQRARNALSLSLMPTVA
eukprot:2783590-Amphidinium_carterae.1